MLASVAVQKAEINPIYVTAATLIVFLAMIMNLAAKPKYAARLNGILIALTGIGGLVIYGYAFSISESGYTTAIIRTLLTVCGIYIGRTDTTAVAGTYFDPKGSDIIGQTIFWVVHLMALYAFASAAITTVGAQALQKLRLLLARWGELNLIYGVNDDSVEFGKSLLGSGKRSVVYVDDKASADLMAAVSKSRCVLRADESAVHADQRFLRSVGISGKKRKITLYALSKDATENVCYAQNLLASMKKAGIAPQQTSLVILGKEDSAAKELQVLGQEYGYGFVTVIHEAGLVGRLLIQNAPPWECIPFDKKGKATEDFEVLQVGFGQLGQVILRQLVMNGQFQGSTFRATVFAPDCEAQMGYFENNFAQVLDNYDIKFQAFDARSKQMYQHILERGNKIKYVVLCTGSEKMNREVAEDLAEFFDHIGQPKPIHRCSYAGITTLASGQVKQHKLYQASVLSTREVDEMAMLLNHYYCNDASKTPIEHWMECSYFNRMSSRASADFVGAMLRAVGKTAEDVAENGWKLSRKQRKNLSRTEHLRWCAFHYCMGFSPMSEEEYDARAQEYKKQLEENGKATIRIAKNMKGRTHACLVEWDELDALSRKEEKILGKKVNYKGLDTKNVLAIPEILKLGRKA